MKSWSVLALALCALAFGCSRYMPQKFVMPSWDTQLSIPVFTGSFTLAQIVGGDSLIASKGDTASLTTIWSTGALSTSENMKLSTIQVGNNLRVDGFRTIHISHALGIFAISSPHPFTYLTTVGGLLGGRSIAGLTIVPKPIPQKTLTSSSTQAPLNFNWVEISTAQLHVNIVNEYCARINFPSGIQFQDSTGSALFTIQLPDSSLDAGESYAETLNLKNMRLPSNPKIKMVVSSPGGSTPVHVRTDSLILITVSLKNIKAIAALAAIDPQPPLVLTGRFPLPDSERIQYASISAGSMAVRMNNYFEMESHVRWNISGLNKSDGSPFAVDQTLDPIGTAEAPSSSSSYSGNYGVSGWSISLGDQPADSMSYSVNVEQPGSDGKFITVTSSDSITGDISLSAVTFSSATGIVRVPNPVQIIPDTQRVSLPSFAKAVNAGDRLSDSTRLTFRLNLSGSLPVRLRLRITARSAHNSETDSAAVTQMLYPGQSGNDVVLGKCFADMLNHFIAATGSFPDMFVVDGTATINPTGEPGTIRKTDAVNGSAAIVCPLDIGLKNFNYTAVSGNLKLNQDIQSGLNDVDSGLVTCEITNAIPLRVNVSLEAIDTLTHKLLFVLPDTGTFKVAAPTRINDDGTIEEPMFSAPVAGISGDKARMLKHSYLECLVTASTSSMDQTVTFNRNSSVSVKIKGDFKLRAGSND